LNATPEFFDPFAIPLVGRDSTLASAARALEQAPGCLVIVGEPKAGVTRFATEVMKIAERRGARLIWAESGPSDPAMRLTASLDALGLLTDLSAAAAAEPFAAYVGVCDEAAQGRFARALSGSAGVVVCEATSSSVAAPSLRIGPLSDDVSTSLVTTVNPSLVPDDVSRIVALADGLPGCLIPLSQTEPSSRIPDELGDLVRRRLGDLDEASVQVIYWSAVLGSFDVGAVAKLTDTARSTVDVVASQFEAAGVFARDLQAQGFLRFVHQLTRWAVAGRKVSGFPAPARFRDSAPRDLLLERQRLIALAEDAGRLRIVLEQTEAALAEWQTEFDGRERLEILVRRARALESSFRVSEALRLLQEVQAGFEARGETERASQIRSRVNILRSRLWERQAAYDELHADAGFVPGIGTASRVELAAQAEAAHVAMRVLRHKEAMVLGEWVLAHPRSAMSAETRVQAALAVALGKALIEPTRDRIDELGGVRVEALELGFAQFAVTAHNFQVTLLGDLFGDYLHAEALGRETAHELRGAGQFGAAKFVELVLGLVLSETGRLKTVDELCAGPDAVDYGSVDFSAFARLWLGRARGDLAEVSSALAPFRGADAEQGPDLFIGLAVNLALSRAGTTRLESEDEALVIRALEVCEDDPGARVLRLLLFLAAIETNVPPGRAKWRAELGVLSEWGAPAVRAYCRYADAFLEDDPERVVSALHDAAVRLEALGIGWWVARARLMAGLLGSGAQAATDLRTARGLFDAMDADGWRRRVEGELRSRGYRWSATSSAPGALSARELEVVRELAAGHSNAQIAERLVLSENTVARHLTRIYRKLGVSGRREAVAAASQTGGFSNGG
jgi:DNA-binding CsgD family transcriptional regulator